MKMKKLTYNIKKKIANIVFVFALVLFMLVTLSFVSNKSNELPCSSIDVNIVDNTGNKFIKKEDIINLIVKKNNKILGHSIEFLDVNLIESKLHSYTSIKHVEVYKTVKGQLKVDIHQKQPIVRVINYNNESYYIDKEGGLMPLSKEYTANVLVVNGSINEPFALKKINNVKELQENNELSRSQILHDIYLMAKHISSNTFWNSQITQIYVNKNNEFELIPRVGRHKILFGTINNYEEKFIKLDAFYKKGLTNVGWNKYSTINLKYKNQVVCTKI